MMISYIGCIPFYYAAGVNYSKFMEMIDFEKKAQELAEEKALGLKKGSETSDEA